MATIHPTAIVSARAELADTCRVGPYCVIEGEVTIGDGTDVGHGCHITGRVSIGRDNELYPYCSVGTAPQDVSYGGETFAVEIGEQNVLREFCTINMGTPKDRKVTSLGDHNYLMAYCHVGHDCDVGNHVVMINNVGLSGHTRIEDHAILSGLTGVHHYVTVGQYAFIGGMSRIIQDAPPYMITEGNPSRVHRVNVIGLQRHDFSEESIDALKRAHRLLYRSKLTRVEAINILEERPEELTAEVKHLIAFLRDQMNGRQGRQREIRRIGDTR
ncbi:MAG: acyl-ACP--UDP-N-acetylglucosamine O-acyltransferase [Planctomycetota bacterium]